MTFLEGSRLFLSTSVAPYTTVYLLTAMSSRGESKLSSTLPPQEYSTTVVPKYLDRQRPRSAMMLVYYMEGKRIRTLNKLKSKD